MKRISIIFLILSISGQLCSQNPSNSLDKNGLKDGPWTIEIVQTSFKFTSSGTFSHGKKTGIWKYRVVETYSPPEKDEVYECKGSMVDYEDRTEEYFDNGDILVTRQAGDWGFMGSSYSLKTNRDSTLITGLIYYGDEKSVNCKCVKSKSVITCKLINSKNKIIDTFPFKQIDYMSEKLDLGFYKDKL